MTGPHWGPQCPREIVLILWTAFPLTPNFMLAYEVEEKQIQIMTVLIDDSSVCFEYLILGVKCYNSL